MISKNSNRNNLALGEYYQLLADIIGIFWEFHKQRIKEGNLPMVMGIGMSEQANFSFIKALRQKAGYPKKFDFLDKFSAEMQYTLEASWSQYLMELGIGATDWNLPPIPETCKSFLHPYVVNLIKKADPMVKEHTKAKLTEKNLEHVVSAGFDTGARVTVQLRAIFKDMFHSSLVLMASKVKQEKLDYVFKNLGIEEDIFDTKFPVTFDLIHPEQGLDRNKLKQYGLGDTRGCPAGIKISPLTREFLQKRCQVNPSETMLADFAVFCDIAFGVYIQQYYDLLSETDREQWISKNNRTIMDGNISNLPKRGERLGFKSGRRER